MKKLALIMLPAILLTGCAAGFRHVERTQDGKYIVTKDQAGAFRQHGEIWLCEPTSALRMRCSELATD